MYPYPADGEKEWVELYNGNDFTVNLEGWYIDDAAGSGSSPKKLTLSIPATSYGTVTFSSSLFNNAGDTVRLLNTVQTEKDSMEYIHAQKQKSFGLIVLTEQEYCIQDPSPNAPNTGCLEPTSSPKPTVEEALLIPKQSPQIKGVASIQNSTQTSSKALSVLPKTSLSTSQPTEEPVVLGAIAPRHVSPTPYFSLTSFAYSLLTIVSVFIKINHA